MAHVGEILAELRNDRYFETSGVNSIISPMSH